MKSIRRVAGQVWRVAAHAQTALGMSHVWTVGSWAAGVMVAALAPVPWYWRIFLLLVVANGVLWGATAIYATFIQDRVTRLRGVRRLLLELAACVRAARPLAYGDAKAAAAFGWTLMRVDRFMRAAFQYRIIADFDACREVAEYKAKQRDEPFQLEEVIACYCERLADTLAVDDIDPVFHLPATFQAYRDAE